MEDASSNIDRGQRPASAAQPPASAYQAIFDVTSFVPIWITCVHTVDNTSMT